MVMPGGNTTPTPAPAPTPTTVVVAGPSYQPLPFVVPGPLGPFVGTIHLPFDADYTIVGVRATLGTPAVGSAFVVDVLVDGATIFTTVANKPTIQPGVNASPVAIPDITSVKADSWITIAALQVGSTTAGADLCVLVSMERAS